MKKNLLSLILLCAFCACSSSDDSSAEDAPDMTPPEITATGITAVPIECMNFKRGEVIPFNYVFTDNKELGNYSIDIHNNFDHHTHSGSATECPLDEKKSEEGKTVWTYTQDSTIPSKQTRYVARVDIPIPANVEPGDYHFSIRLTDAAGWQTIKAIAIKITE